MKNRIEVEQVENGFEVTVWEKPKEDAEGHELMYHEPKKFIAKDIEEVMEIFSKKFKKVKESDVKDS